MSPGGEEVGGEGGRLKNCRKSEVLRMSWPIVENVRTSSESLTSFWTHLEASNSHIEKNRKIRRFLPKIQKSRMFPLFSVWGPLLLSLLSHSQHMRIGGLCKGRVHRRTVNVWKRRKKVFA